VRLTTENSWSTGATPAPGGGNALVLGGATRLILRSCVVRICCAACWATAQPSPLSYLFSGLFVGPTSQAPRTKKRATIAVQLELAFKQCRRWSARRALVVDRCFAICSSTANRNTHRSEFCIDKMFSPTATPPPGVARDARV